MLFLEGRRNGYAPDQCGRTMTIGELIAFLSDFDEDQPVFLRNDRGYTYGSVTENSFEQGDESEEE